MTLDILVDYDNISRVDRNFGLDFVVDKVLTTLSAQHLQPFHRATFRLYGGWYRKQRLTRYAQQVAASALASFPTVKTVVDGGASSKLIVNVELAYSINVNPSFHLFHTYRPRQGHGGISCSNPSRLCSTSGCRMADTYAAFNNNCCPDPGCSVDTGRLFSRNEQKLVDSMVVADIFHAVSSGARAIAVVSSDDDMWPGIMTAVEFGIRVFHVRTRPGPVKNFYSGGMSRKYTSLTL